MNTAGDREDIPTFSACYSVFAGLPCSASVHDRASFYPDVTFVSLPIVETLLGFGYLSYVFPISAVNMLQFQFPACNNFNGSTKKNMNKYRLKPPCTEQSMLTEIRLHMQ